MSEEIVLDSIDERNTVPASIGKRILNGLIDVIFFYIIVVMLGFTTVLFGNLSASSGSFLYNIIGYIIYILYYFVMEASTGKTIGKMITKTKVVKEDGSESDTYTAFIRSVSRLIPFEAFSLLGKDRIGWHDSIAKSRVVNA